LILDLSAVRFFGTAGLRILVSAWNKRPDLQLVCNASVLKILEMTGLGDLFPVSASVVDALASRPHAE
jgi:anti-anti-sigma factor